MTGHRLISMLETAFFADHNIIIETSITSANKHNFSVEHLFKNKLSLRDF
jgi:hypothetical protein